MDEKTCKCSFVAILEVHQYTKVQTEPNSVGKFCDFLKYIFICLFILQGFSLCFIRILCFLREVC